MENENKVFGTVDACETASKAYGMMNLQHNIQCADMMRPPKFELCHDETAYNGEGKIHVGTLLPITQWQITDEEMYISALTYLYGHENQHARSTSQTPYADAIFRSARMIVEEIAKRLNVNTNTRFRKDDDYRRFCDEELPKNGVYITWAEICGYTSWLANSLEDGRIERIRGIKYPGFEIQRKFFRGLQWMGSEYESLTPSAISNISSEGMFAILNDQIYSLATSHLYKRGFLQYFYDTPIMDYMTKMMPHISAAVMAGTCRQMSKEAVEVAKIIMPLFVDLAMNQPKPMVPQGPGGAGKNGQSQSKASKEAMEQLKKEIARRIKEMLDDKMETNLNENQEESDDGMPSDTSLGDLEITLDDETYDKLVEKMKNKKSAGSGSGVGVNIKREHPKDGDDSGDQRQANGNQNGSGKDGEKQAAGQNGQDGKKTNGSQSSDSSGASDSNDGDASSDASSKSKDGSSSPIGGKTADGAADQVLQEMKEAAENARIYSRELANGVNRMAAAQAQGGKSQKVINDKYPTLTQNDVRNSVQRQFREFKRKYHLDKQMDSMLAATSKVFRRENEKFFKSMWKPTYRHLSSGAIDASSIFSLALNETDVFKRTGESSDFDGRAYILIDNSGSMSGQKRMEAARAAAMIEEGFKGFFPFKIVAFDDQAAVNHEVIKGWDEMQRLNCTWNWALHGRCGGDTPTADSIRIATQEFNAFGEHKKLLVVMTDGAPNDPGDTKRAVMEAQKKGIQVIAIYFDNYINEHVQSSFQNMFGKDVVFCEVKQIRSKLTKLIQKWTKQ